MFMWQKRLDRRTFLRGAGASVALPLLDAMIPVRVLLAAVRPVRRLAFVYFPHGLVMDEWMPADERGPRLGRILEPLSAFANRLTVFGGVENRLAYGPVHAITPGTWLSMASSLDALDGMQPATADQLAADDFAEDTPLPSIALTAEEPKAISAGIWGGRYDPSLGQTISFRRGGVPVPMTASPRLAFDALFGCDAAPAALGASVLDRIAADAARLRTRLGSSDRAAVDGYLAAVRAVERRVERLESNGGEAHGPRRASVGDDGDVERRFVERLSLMFDLTALAFRADITRVASMMMAAETSTMTYRHAGAPEPFHALSHHQNDREKLEKLVRIQTFHTRMLVSFVQSLAEHRDGDGSILDRTHIVYGSNMSDSQRHDHYPLPIALIGPRSSPVPGPQVSATGAARSAPGADRTPMSAVLRSVLRRG
jgi:hypothetical protein